jgi:hypothetical protein
MRAISGREFARMVERRGWHLLRINGSHHVYGKRAASSDSRFPFMATARSSGLPRHLAKLAEIPDDGVG